MNGTEISHFTKGYTLYHAYYLHTNEKGRVSWRMIYGSDVACMCPEREADRQTLLRIRREEEVSRG